MCILEGLSTEIVGVKLKFPTVLSSGPLSRDEKSIKRAMQQRGLGAITTKTILKSAGDTPRPSMAVFKDNLINFDWDHPGVDSIINMLKTSKDGGFPIIANVIGPVDETARMCQNLEKAGAAMIESFESEEHIKAIKDTISIPLVIKLNPNLPDIAKRARMAEKAGADAISAIGTVGPGLVIDTRTGKPLLGSKYGFGNLTGPAIKPIALRCVAEIAMAVKIPILGGGGITNGKDAMEMFMIGAKCVHLHTAAILGGLGVFEKIINEVKEIMKERGYESLEDVRGMSLKYLDEKPKYELHPAKVNVNLCNGCGICERVCAYDAIRMEERIARVDEKACFGCGLCVSICPTRAIKVSLD